LYKLYNILKILLNTNGVKAERGMYEFDSIYLYIFTVIFPVFIEKAVFDDCISNGGVLWRNLSGRFRSGGAVR
ncbi:MAG: hypothetical protein K2I21_10435, partial [Acetatifactor sp.]|nr:hypothetical protein [Acetatifactor sp.]